MTGTELALRIVFAAAALVCLLTVVIVEARAPDIGCLTFIALYVVFVACLIGAFAEPDAIAAWLHIGVHP